MIVHRLDPDKATRYTLDCNAHYRVATMIKIMIFLNFPDLIEFPPCSPPSLQIQV